MHPQRSASDLLLGIKNEIDCQSYSVDYHFRNYHRINPLWFDTAWPLPLLHPHQLRMYWGSFSRLQRPRKQINAKAGANFSILVFRRASASPVKSPYDPWGELAPKLEDERFRAEYVNPHLTLLSLVKTIHPAELALIDSVSWNLRFY